jgi:predicted component of type VI protein secretion system
MRLWVSLLEEVMVPYLELRFGSIHEPKVTGAEVTTAPDGALWVRLPRGALTVGRAPSREPKQPHLQLVELTLSRWHFSVIPFEGGFAVRDDGSSGGTYLNDKEVLGRRTPRPLQDGDRIHLGSPSCKAVAVFRKELPPAG